MRAEYALPAPSAHWPPPPHYTYAQPHHISTGGCFYYQGVGKHDTAQHGLQPQQPQQVRGQSIIQIPHYSISSAVHQPIISPVPPPLELPLPVRRSGEPPPALGAKVPSVHELPGFKETLPAIDSKIPSLKDSLAMRAHERAVLSDHAVSKVPDIAPPFGNTLSKADRSCMTNVLAPSQLSEEMELSKEHSGKVKKEEEQKSPRAKRGRGIADLMNPMDTPPGQSAGPDLLTLNVKSEVRKDDLTQKGTKVLTDSMNETKPDESAAVKREEETERAEEPKLISVSVTSSTEEAERKRKFSSSRTIKHDERKIRTQDARFDEKRGETSSEEAEYKAEAQTEKEAEGVEEVDEDDDEKYEDSEETRCPCGSAENSGFMIACDECNTWQHGRCMGYRGKSEVPEKYYCNICRPEEMRPTCVAYRKYKERQLLKEKDDTDTKPDSEALLAMLKPLELRRHFIADMKQKRNGQKLSKSDLFHRYAILLRNQFTKHRQSIVEGLVILFDMHRGEVVDKLESALKRLRNSSVDKNKDDSLGRKRGGVDGSQDGVHSDAGGTRSNGHARVNHQKRARSSSLSLDGVERGKSHGDPNYSNETITDVDAVGADGSSGRGLSREDRKLQQAMKLFAQMEERERERKKPRVGESGTSPKVGQAARQKPTKQAVHAPSSSPKSANSNTPNDLDEDIAKVELSETFGGEVGGNGFMLQRHIQKPELDHAQTCSQQGYVQEQPQPKQARKDAGGIGPDVDASRNGFKRERDQKSRDKLDKAPGRRKESSASDLSLVAGNGRRRSILDRDRPPDAKKRRTGGGTKESDRKLLLEKEEARRDPSLKFRLFVAGPTALGSRLIPVERLSAIERELRASEDGKLAMARKIRAFRANRKEWICAMSAPIVKQNEWKRQSPVKKRFTSAEVDKVKSGSEVELEKIKCARAPASARKKAGTVSVSMVVVSEKHNLPDRGQMLESSRLIVPNNRNEADHPVLPASHAASKTTCLKKRERLRGNVSSNDAALIEAETKPSEPSPSSPTNRVNKSTPSVLSPPQPTSPTSPQHIKSPILRSSPVHALTGLRSVSSPTKGKAIRIPSPVSSPRSTRPSLATRSSSFLPQEPQFLELFRSNPTKVAIPSPDSNDPVAGRTPRKVSDISRESEPAQIPYQSDSILSSKLVSMRSVPPSPAAGSMNNSVPSGSPKLRALTNGLGLRSIRSVPLSGLKRSATSDNGSCLPRDTARENSKAGSPLASPHKNEFSSSPAVSDFFQQRLEGFLKPKVASVDEHASSRNGFGPSSSFPNVPNGTVFPPGNVVGTGTLHPRNGFASNGMPSYGSRPTENGSHWRPAISSKKPLASCPVVRAPTQAASPVTGIGRGTHIGILEKPRFRGGRVDATNRSDENVSNRNGSTGPWNYTGKSGWVGGGGRMYKTMNEPASKANRRERN